MQNRFDSLAKTVSGAVSRRQAFLRLGSGLGVGALALFGLGSKAQAQAQAPEPSCEQICAYYCLNLTDPPPHGAEFADCIRDCIEGCHV